MRRCVQNDDGHKPALQRVRTRCLSSHLRPTDTPTHPPPFPLPPSFPPYPTDRPRRGPGVRAPSLRPKSRAFRKTTRRLIGQRCTGADWAPTKPRDTRTDTHTYRSTHSYMPAHGSIWCASSIRSLALTSYRPTTAHSSAMYCLCL